MRDPGRVLHVSVVIDFATILQPGDTVAWPQGPGEPTGLVAELVARRHELPPLTLFAGLGVSGTVTADCADRFRLLMVNGGGRNRIWSGVAEVIPAHSSAIPGLLRSRVIPVDVALLRVRPHSPGFVTTGVIADYTQALVASARVVVAELDERLPLTGDDALLPAGAIHHLVPASGADLLLSDPAPSETERAVAARVAALIPDGATLQLGIGTLPAAIARALASHRELGIHTGVVSDVLVELVEAGAVTNARKGRDAGRTVTGGLFGSERLRRFADGNPALAMRSSDYTHHPAVLASLQALYAVNSAIELDLTGQVNAELAGGRYLGAVGGQVDFMRGANASPGGRAIIALPSTTADGRRSRIVASLHGRPVTTPRSDIDLVVTEFGVAELRGRSLPERARRLLAIAHPAFQDELAAVAGSR